MGCPEHIWCGRVTIRRDKVILHGCESLCMNESGAE